MSKIRFEVVSGVEGPCLCIVNDSGGFRLAGPKPWGGGTVKHTFSVDRDELLEQIKVYSDETK